MMPDDAEPFSNAELIALLEHWGDASRVVDLDRMGATLKALHLQNIQNERYANYYAAIRKGEIRKVPYQAMLISIVRDMMASCVVMPWSSLEKNARDKELKLLIEANDVGLTITVKSSKIIVAKP